MKFDFSKLRGRIVEKFGTCAKFAASMGRSKVWENIKASFMFCSLAQVFTFYLSLFSFNYATESSSRYTCIASSN